ncbi:haloacid dehalogenase [Pleurocapsa sp. CCALA 161]|uniref:HAD family hydrolase n=1 Tax=Pleurocapsa sp. CCALA 161 TaxID=2107688 RepID=UPI000D0552DD|nr:haloacid dehalogenase [Pleurocapsa sp. CCALA 161]
MMSRLPDILALDFDGVVCDGLLEYFATTKQTYQQIWSAEVDDSFAPSFYRLRPVIETGWEMPILLRALVSGISEAEILNNFKAIAIQITEAEGLSKQAVVQKLDGVRDDWIKHNFADWLSLHRFYPGMIEQLGQIINSAVKLYIVTTKEGRFVKQLLQQQGIDLPAVQIIGKESKRPKYETLRILRDRHQQPGENIQITFVEDRLPALQQVAQQEDLLFVELYLADWGYNLEGDCILAAQDRRIKLLSLEHFCQDLASW